MTAPVTGMPPQLAADLARGYDILRLLGRGGMGAVWLARERSLDRMVAVKVLAGEAVDTSEVRERFRREARIAARLVHPNIVPLLAFGETPDSLYYVMGFVDGETLAARLAREGRIARAVAGRILTEVADALAFAHHEGVVHRDVKPENILLDARTGRALLADFGVARVTTGATSVTMTGMAVGTPSYMSPEQAMGAKDIDGRSDVYALGVVGYRMLMGRLPFTGDSVQALLAQHAVARPDDLALAMPRQDRDIAEIIMRALEKDPAARWARADDLRDELQQAVRTGVTLPEDLERVQSTGTKLLMAGVVTGVMTNWALVDAVVSGRMALSTALSITAGAMALFPLIGAFVAAPTARKAGWRETLRAMLHPLESWSSWWPRAFRRPDDIWDRLPAPLRRARNWTVGVVTWFAFDMLVALPLFITTDSLLPWLRWTGQLGLPDGMDFALPKLMALSWTVFEVIRARKKLGLGSQDFAHLMTLPNVSSHPSWSRPKFAKLLSSIAPDAPGSRLPQTPAELVDAIGRLNVRLQRAGLLPDDEGARAAEAVRTAIAALEAEVEQLHRELDPAEGDRIERRLAALGHQGDDADLRRLLESQRTVLKRLEVRRHEKEARRDRLRDQLVMLCMQMLDLDARLAQGTAGDPELTGRVRALSHDLKRSSEALQEVEALIAPTTPPVTTPT